MPKGVKYGGGSRKGIPNRSTANAREAIAAFVEKQTPRLSHLLERIEAEEGPMAAFRVHSGHGRVPRPEAAAH